MPAIATASTVVRAGPFMIVSFSFRASFERCSWNPLKLAAGGSLRSQVEKIVLLFAPGTTLSGRANPYKALAPG